MQQRTIAGVEGYTPAACGARLRAWRRWRRLSQQELAAQVGTQQPRISAMEHGRRMVLDLGLLCRLCAVLGCSADALLFGPTPPAVPGPTPWHPTPRGQPTVGAPGRRRPAGPPAEAS